MERGTHPFETLPTEEKEVWGGSDVNTLRKKMHSYFTPYTEISKETEVCGRMAKKCVKLRHAIGWEREPPQALEQKQNYRLKIAYLINQKISTPFSSLFFRMDTANVTFCFGVFADFSFSLPIGIDSHRISITIISWFFESKSSTERSQPASLNGNVAVCWFLYTHSIHCTHSALHIVHCISLVFIPPSKWLPKNKTVAEYIVLSVFFFVEVRRDNFKGVNIFPVFSRKAKCAAVTHKKCVLNQIRIFLTCTFRLAASCYTIFFLNEISECKRLYQHHELIFKTDHFRLLWSKISVGSRSKCAWW